MYIYIYVTSLIVIEKTYLIVALMENFEVN